MTLARVVREALLAAVVGASTQVCRADDTPSSRSDARLVNLEAPGTPARHELSPQFGARFFDSPESIAYSSLSFRYGLRSRIEVGVRATIGSTRSLPLSAGPSILYGGRDVELFGKVAAASIRAFVWAGRTATPER